MRKFISYHLLGLSVWLAGIAMKIYEPPYIPIKMSDAVKLFGATQQIPKGKLN